MAAPPPAGVWRRTERNKQKLVGQDKGNLTEQQTKGTGTTTIQIMRIHNTKQQNAESNSHHPPHAPKPQLPSCCRSSPQPEPSMTAHGMEHPALFGL